MSSPDASQESSAESPAVTLLTSGTSSEMTGGTLTFSSTSAVTMLFKLTTTWHWYLTHNGINVLLSLINIELNSCKKLLTLLWHNWCSSCFWILTPEDQGSNPAISIFKKEFLFSFNCGDKTKIKKKEASNGPTALKCKKFCMIGSWSIRLVTNCLFS